VPKKKLVLGQGLILALLSITLVPSHAQNLKTLKTHVAAQSIPSLGRLAPETHLTVSMTLPLHQQEQLNNLLQDLYNPRSGQYHKFLTVSEFTERFGPTEDEYQQVRAFAEQHHLKVIKDPANRLVVTASGTSSDMEQAFHVTMLTHQHPTEKRIFHAPDHEPQVDSDLPIAVVEGLSDFSLPRHVGPTHLISDVALTIQGTAPGGEFSGFDIRNAYFPGTNLDGTGQSVGIYASAFNLSDIELYFENLGETLTVPAFVVNANDGDSLQCSTGCNDGETSVDAEQILSVAPHLTALDFYEASNELDAWNDMAALNIDKQLSTSIVFLPADPTEADPIFEEMAAQGQSFFVASGDSGAFSQPGCTGSCNPVFYPSDDPFVTSAGGTDLNTSSPGGPWQSESAWIGSSGGISTNGFAIPSYQVPFINAPNNGSTTLRNVPDVAANANTDNFFCANGSCSGGLGGTSFAAPSWAAFMALANQQAAEAGGGPIGFLNPLIYSIASRPNYTEVFHDITSGNNFNSISPNLYSAVTGYDLVTGLGSPNGQEFLNAIAVRNLNGKHVLTPLNAMGSRLDDAGANTTAGNTIDIFTANGTAAQNWVFSNTNVAPAGNYNIAVSLGAFCMTASGSTAGSLVNLQPCNGSPAQSWNAVLSEGSYLFHPASNPSLCLDVTRDLTTNGTPLQIFTCNGLNDEQWVVD
jgi:subtilase family serine protease